MKLGTFYCIIFYGGTLGKIEAFFDFQLKNAFLFGYPNFYDIMIVIARKALTFKTLTHKKEPHEQARHCNHNRPPF